MEINRIVLDTVDSTNSFAKRMGETFETNTLTIITAKEQTGGRGRFSRSWKSPPSTNLLVTFSLYLPSNTSDLFRIGQLFSLCALFLLQEEQLHPLIKWPNDLLIGEKKIGGILTEMQQIKNGYQVILGLGLNVNADKKWLLSIDQAATSMLVESNKSWDLEHLTQKLAHIFIAKLKLFTTKGFEPFQKEFVSHMAFLGQRIQRGEWKGVFEGIDLDGALLLRLDNGSIKKIINE